ncbi:MAG: hypothetical protein JSW10_08010 [Pseudomonadota bacterium]|nr:MAG: hypothetical protein JSW10_08010 [Pseudomonadota bacterium]
MGRDTNQLIWIAKGVTLVALLIVSGCASMQSRTSQENVAKDWCQSIRANQILCTYPLTEDLRPGDVFLVQVPIERQTELYRKKGFLSLDDHRGRLQVRYNKMYFDGYFKDEFGATPHERPLRAVYEPMNPAGTGPAIAKTEIKAPRAAFPTYRFEATSSGGVSLAIPVQGVPIGLGYLAAEKVAGTVTIADARTYAADTQGLFEALRSWTDDPTVQRMLSDALRQTGKDVLYLRTVSRVYLTGGVIVLLTTDKSKGAQAQVGGVQPPDTPTIGAQASASQDTVLSKLNTQAAALSTQLPGTGAIKFASASSSAVALSESFDRPLVIGYLAFDVPVYSGGVLGAPIPTFERLEGQVPAPAFRAGTLSLDQARYKVEEHALEALAKKDLERGLKVATLTARNLDANEFAAVRQQLAAAEKARQSGEAEWETMAKQALTSYKAAALGYVSASGQHGPNYGRYSDAFARAYERHVLP